MPVGFKWFVDGLLSGSCAFGGEESAGASFLRRDGTVWTTDKDGIILDLLAAEITAVHGKDPGEHYRALEREHGAPVYERIDAPATRPQQKALSRALRRRGHAPPNWPASRSSRSSPARRATTRRSAGSRSSTENGWFAARPSGTEDIYKIYAESFRGEEHLRRIQEEAQAIVSEALGG